MEVIAYEANAKRFAIMIGRGVAGISDLIDCTI